MTFPLACFGEFFFLLLICIKWHHGLFCSELALIWCECFLDCVLQEHTGLTQQLHITNVSSSQRD